MNSMETERLILRPWLADDLDDLYEYSSDERVGSMAGWKPHISREEARSAVWSCKGLRRNLSFFAKHKPQRYKGIAAFVDKCYCT